MVGDPRVPVSGIAYDSRRVRSGNVFVALRGATADGHDFLADALARGAAALVVERRPESGDVPVAVVGDSRAALAALAVAFYRRPSHRLPVVGVTGTNGKTTVTYLLEALLDAAGGRPAVIGTTGLRFAGTVTPLPNTTPESLEVQRLLRELSDRHATHVALEASSHGLQTHRLDGCRFAARAFLNLSRDHLDFHGDMDRYLAAKRRLFTEHEGGPAAINADDSRGRLLVGELDGAVAFSTDPGSGAPVRPLAPAVLSPTGIRVRLATPAGPVEVASPLVGAPNLENLVATATLGGLLGLPPTTLSEGLSRPVAVPGRLQRVPDPAGRRTVLVDYAHTPAALARALSVVRGLVPGRVGVVFGCGGERDAGKRPEMGRAAAHGADRVFLTSDNPRGEDPRAILDDVAAGVPPEARACLVADPDRRAALAAALGWAAEGDAVLVAGKGHETTQESGGVRRAFDDAAVCEDLLRETP